MKFKIYRIHFPKYYFGRHYFVWRQSFNVVADKWALRRQWLLMTVSMFLLYATIFSLFNLILDSLLWVWLIGTFICILLEPLLLYSPQSWYRWWQGEDCMCMLGRIVGENSHEI